MVDTSKIKVGDWVDVWIHGWFRISRPDEICILGGTVCYDPTHTKIEAHRPAEGPFKKGDMVRWRGGVEREIVDTKAGLDEEWYATRYRKIHKLDDIELVKPVEAIKNTYVINDHKKTIEEDESTVAKNTQKTLNDYASEVHEANKMWWRDLETGEPIERNKGELLALIHSEVSECLEGVRKDLQDDKLPHRKMEEVELADAIIRILDYCGGYGLDIHGAYIEKMEYNANRADHKHENRKKENGKRF